MTSTAFPLKKVLIANRGEIAVRIARSARDLGITSVAVYSEADVDNLHPQMADEAYALQGNSSAETYMNIPALVDIALRSGADGVHPGYGFLSENAEFAQAVTDAGLTWVGPTPEAIEALGNKVTARTLASKAGAPMTPGTPDPIASWEEARDFADEHGIVAQVAVEEAMACGVGICMTCVMPVRDAKGRTSMVRSCLDGPVFRGDRVRWEAFEDGLCRVPADAIGAAKEVRR